ncbi:hypothetical protein IHE55_14035 [Streptomyces pactum]|uniref:Entry exclusion lipoprotein TrbK n=1 Tax=Streptomyces pactum TaxID=68249 RepID=A0ABS0NKX8_9ACTN|nr:hypothetical protein [Streptomyces pactum]MBH5335845.1 hypothetical protein [Streptomyces pactum]
MRIRLIATLLAVPTTAVLLAGCSSIEGNTDRPGPSRTGHTLKSSLTEEEAAAQKERDMELCVDAVTERAGHRRGRRRGSRPAP